MDWAELGVDVLGDALTWSSTVLGHVLNWPVMLFAVVYMFRVPIRRLISRVRSYKGFNNEVEFALERAEDATEDAAEHAVTKQPAHVTQPAHQLPAPSPRDAPTADSAPEVAPTGAGVAPTRNEQVTLRARTTDSPLGAARVNPQVLGVVRELGKQLEVEHPSTTTLQAIIDGPKIAMRAAWTSLGNALRTKVPAKRRGVSGGLVAAIADAADHGEIDFAFAEALVELNNAYWSMRQSRRDLAVGAAMRFVDTAMQLRTVALNLDPLPAVPAWQGT